MTFLPTNTTSRKWRATPLRHDATLTKSRSDVSRPTDAFRNILCQVAQPFVSPSLISLRTCLMVADALTKRRTDVSRPTDAFRNICLGGANMYLQHRRCQVAQPCVSPSPISRGGDCLHARHLLITQKAPLRYDATLPTPAPMFLVLRTRFATSAWGQICTCNIVDAKLLNRFRFTIQAHQAS